MTPIAMRPNAIISQTMTQLNGLRISSVLMTRTGRQLPIVGTAGSFGSTN